MPLIRVLALALGLAGLCGAVACDDLEPGGRRCVRLGSLSAG